MKIDPNEPAFPAGYAPGMTYRQWLVGIVAGGVASNTMMTQTFEALHHMNDASVCGCHARLAINIADAIIAELNKENL